MRQAWLVAALLFVLVPTAVALGGPTLSAPSGAGGVPAVPDAGGVFPTIDLSSALVIGAGVTLAVAAATLFFLGGAKFVNSGNVLENDARRQIFEHIQAHPGIHLRAAATQLSLSTTNVLWHLRKLEDANLVTSKKFEGYKVFYPVEGGVETKKKAIAHSVLKNENATAILEYVTAHPSAHQREIARALGVNHGTVRWHLRKLEEAELIMPMKRDHTVSYYVSELGHTSLAGNAARALATPSPPPAPPAARVPSDES